MENDTASARFAAMSGHFPPALRLKPNAAPASNSPLSVCFLMDGKR